MGNDLVDLAKNWLPRVRASQRMHYRCSNHFTLLNRLLGIPATVLSALVGASVFASITKQASPDMKLLAGFASLFTTILVALQTHLGYSDRAERHRQAGAGYGSIKRDIEVLAATTLTPSEFEPRLLEVKKQIDGLEKSVPEVPERIRNRALLSEGIKPSS